MKDEQPLTNTPRCQGHDLRIMLKFMDENGKTVTKKYPMYKLLLADHGEFMDTLKSVDPKERIDATPAVFGKALRFLRDPLACRAMTPQDALEVVSFYAKHACLGGLRLCDEVLLELVKKNDPLYMEVSTNELDLLVDAVAVACHLNLPKTRDVGIAWISKKLQAGTRLCFDNTMFSHLQVAKLQPLAKLLGLFKESFPADTPEEEIRSPEFPRYTEFTSQCNTGIVVPGRGRHNENGALTEAEITSLYQREHLADLWW
jgi:hypothetical protein